MKAALFRKQQEYKKEKSSSLHVESGSPSSTVAAAQNAVEKAGRKVSEKVSVWCTRYVYMHIYMYINTKLVLLKLLTSFDIKCACNPDQDGIN